MTYTEKECWRAFGAGTIVGGLGVFVVMGTIVYTTEWGKPASTMPLAATPSQEVEAPLEVHLQSSQFSSKSPKPYLQETGDYSIAKAKGDKKGWAKSNPRKSTGVQALTTERSYPFPHIDYANPYHLFSQAHGGTTISHRRRPLGR